jgi:hypothetical protein
MATEAEEENNPRILCLVAKCGPELTGTLTTKEGVPSKLVGLSGKTIEATKAELKLEKCESIAGHETDTNLCKNVPVTFTGFKKEKVACRSETAVGAKDPVETVLTLLDLHLAAETTSGGVLQPILTAAMLGAGATAEKEETLKLICGVVKVEINNGEAKPKDGVLACLILPGLENVPTTVNVKVTCEVQENAKKEFDPLTGTCKILCEDFGKIGVSANLGDSECLRLQECSVTRQSPANRTNLDSTADRQAR